MRELVFEVTQEEDGGFCAKAIGESIFTQGDTWDELREMVLDATRGYFYDSQPPDQIRLELVRSEVPGGSVKIPRDVHGRDFADHLVRRWNYLELRQTGSHIILRTETPFPRTISIPAHKPLRPGTFRDALEDVAHHKGVSIEDFLRKL